MDLLPVVVEKPAIVVVDLYLRAKSQGSRHTLKAYREDLVRFLAFIGDTPLHQLAVSDMLAFRESLAGKSPSVQARAISTVRSLFQWSVRHGFLRFNIAIVLDVPKVPVTSENRFLTDAEVQSLLRALKERSARDYLIGVLLLKTGARLEEVTAIRWQHFYQDRKGYIGLTLHGKGNKTRDVQITPDLWTLIRAHRGTDALDPQDATPLVALSMRQIERVISDTAKAAGIQKRISPHWLRHTAVTMALEGGAPVEQVQQMAGHSDLRTTTRYIHAGKHLSQSATQYIHIPVD